MRRLTRAAAALLAFFSLATPVAPPPAEAPAGPAAARLFAESVALNPGEPAAREFGPFRYLGGWVLTSDDRRFGAISSMHVDGGHVLAVSDRGTIFRFRVPGSGGDRLAILPLAQGPGSFTSNVERDSESLALHEGRLWLGFENSNAVWRYRSDDLRATGAAEPTALRNWPANRGAEAMARLPDGRFLLIGEDKDDAGTSPAVLFSGDPAEPQTAAMKLRFGPPAGHRVTDAAILPNGRLLLLSRGFTLRGGWSAKLLTADLPERPDETVQTWEVATLVAPLTRDNMEALSVTREGGRTIVWIASDDNLNPLQRTLLMKFELAE